MPVTTCSMKKHGGGAAEDVPPARAAWGSGMRGGFGERLVEAEPALEPGVDADGALLQAGHCDDLALAESCRALSLAGCGLNLHERFLIAGLVGERGHFAGVDHEVAVRRSCIGIRRGRARRAGGARAVFVVGAAVAWAQEELRLREPAHRAAEVRAVDGEDLELLALRCGGPSRRHCRSAPSESVVTGLRKSTRRVSPSGKLVCDPRATQAL